MLECGRGVGGARPAVQNTVFVCIACVVSLITGLYIAMQRVYTNVPRLRSSTSLKQEHYGTVTSPDFRGTFSAHLPRWGRSLQTSDRCLIRQLTVAAVSPRKPLGPLVQASALFHFTSTLGRHGGAAVPTAAAQGEKP